MAENINTSFIEKTLKDLVIEVKDLTTVVAKLQHIAETQKDLADENAQKLKELSNKYDGQIDTLKSDIQQAKGAISFLKSLSVFGTLIGGVLITFTTWTASSISSNQQRLAEMGQKAVMLEHLINKVDAESKAKEDHRNEVHTQ